MADSAKINDALGQLDTENDNHWTQMGEPRLETLRMLVGDQSISRADVDAATKDYNRSVARQNKAAPPAPEAPANVLDAGAPGGVVTGDPVPPVPAAGETQIAITPPLTVDGAEAPAAPPLPAVPPADGLPTAAEPAMVEGGTPVPAAQNVDTLTTDVEGSVEAGRPVQIAQGTTEKGYNALNSEADDLRDAQASTAPSPNAPAGLGGAPGARSEGLTNEAGSDESTEQRPGEAQLSPVDRGAVGDSDAVADLEAELEEVVKATAYAQAEADKWQGRLAQAAAEQSRIRIAIEKARPRGGTMPAIQDYFSRQDQVTSDLEETRRAVKAAGIDPDKIKKLFDKAPADKTAG